MASVSLNTAALLCNLSKRTLWRHIENGSLTAQGPSQPGGCTLVRLADLMPLCALDRLDEPLVLAADRGEAAAQRDLALAFLEAGHEGAAWGWLTLAARQGDADALYRLGRAQLCRDTSDAEREEALLWLNQAAVKGHGLARALAHWLQEPAGQAALADAHRPGLAAHFERIERDTLLRALAETAEAA